MGKIGSPFAFDGAGAYIGVLERDAPVSEMRWIEAPVCFVFITSTRGMRASKSPLMLSISRWHPTSPIPTATCPVTLKRRAASPMAPRCQYRSIDRELLVDVAAEFPRIDDRFAMGRHRTDFWRPHLNVSGATADSFTRLPHRSGVRSATSLGRRIRSGVSEPVFVERSKQAEEGAGWLWQPCMSRTAYSSLVVLDAMAVADGPVPRSGLIIACRLDSTELAPGSLGFG